MKKLENFNENKSIKLEKEKISTKTNRPVIGLFKVKKVAVEETNRVVLDSVAESIFTNPQPKQPEEDPMLKCKFAAIVMDRLFFFVSLFYAIITFVSLIMSIPNLYK